MLFILRFSDKPGTEDIRRQHLAAHIAWLDEHRQQIKAAGSLRHAPEEDPIGGLWVVEAPDKAAALACFASDPFWLHGLRESVEVLHWSKAFPDATAEV